MQGAATLQGVALLSNPRRPLPDRPGELYVDAQFYSETHLLVLLRLEQSISHAFHCGGVYSVEAHISMPHPDMATYAALGPRHYVLVADAYEVLQVQEPLHPPYAPTLYAQGVACNPHRASGTFDLNVTQSVPFVKDDLPIPLPIHVGLVFPELWPSIPLPYEILSVRGKIVAAIRDPFCHVLIRLDVAVRDFTPLGITQRGLLTNDPMPDVMNQHAEQQEALNIAQNSSG